MGCPPDRHHLLQSRPHTDGNLLILIHAQDGLDALSPQFLAPVNASILTTGSHVPFPKLLFTHLKYFRRYLEILNFSKKSFEFFSVIFVLEIKKFLFQKNSNKKCMFVGIFSSELFSSLSSWTFLDVSWSLLVQISHTYIHIFPFWPISQMRYRPAAQKIISYKRIQKCKQCKRIPSCTLVPRLRGIVLL